MKTKKGIIAGALMLFSFFMVNTSHAQDAVAYMDKITRELKTITSDTWDYTSTVARGKSARKVEAKRNAIIKSNQNAQKKIGAMEPFQGSTAFRDSVLSFLKLSYNILNYDYSKVVDMEEVAEQSYDLMEAYLLAQEKAGDKLGAASDMLTREQKKFAEKNNITLVEGNDKAAKKLEVAGLVFDYYNVVYLIFFKNYKQEVYVLDAMQRADVNAMNQNLNSLAKFANEGLKKMDTLRNFNNDASLKMACKEMLEFYKTEAETKLPALAKFYVTKESFDKIKASFDAKAPKDRTQKDVDDYNQAVKDFNQSLNEFNAVNAELNNKRNALLNKWNKTATEFTDKHVPKN